MLNASGLQGRYSDDYPSRETALAIVEAMKTADGWETIGRDLRLADAHGTAHRCYLVYDYPELSRWTAEVFMSRPWKANPTPAPRELPAPDLTDGFTPRR